MYINSHNSTNTHQNALNSKVFPFHTLYYVVKCAHYSRHPLSTKSVIRCSNKICGIMVVSSALHNKQGHDETHQANGKECDKINTAAVFVHVTFSLIVRHEV